LINIAQCQRRLGDLKAARATYQKFVMVAPDSPLVPQAKAMVEELDKLLAEIANVQPGKETGDDAQKQKLVQAPAPADDEPAAAAPVVTAAVPAAATSAPVLVASPSSEPEPPAPARRRWWLWGTIGAVVVGGAVTAFVLSSGGTTTTVHDGSLGTLRR
jgi:hypothetical protein